MPGDSRSIRNDCGEHFPLAHENRYAGAEAGPDFALSTRSRGERNILYKLLKKVRNPNLGEADHCPQEMVATAILPAAIHARFG